MHPISGPAPSAPRATGPRLPRRIGFAGRAATLEPLSQAHVDELWLAMDDAEDSWRYLNYGPFASRRALAEQVASLVSRSSPLYWAVRRHDSGRAEGWLSLCDWSLTDASLELGGIWFGPALQRTRAGTEAVFLLLRYVFEDLRFERLVWRSLTDNTRSLHAARRYGFRPEGIWRSAARVKGRRGDVAWHGLLAAEWPAQRERLAGWLDERNFGADGRARTPLALPL
ncbi:GNAT family N-acetyltransferase [Bordetella genomosp. 1]|uniref:GNAT family N-acetyltransferase n=1 Tax=Bordetella genomosp. 1 TaxID=1395607 RepID=A0A261SUQ7_9BORD|nr:GNAT family protein [Bordetella genomosp. 1]MDQ8032535.1 GNAT family protein [Bordetella sp.]OZI41098.1 GNAT family N-acetyltransferase [Bordetella genomosp. 1]OZI69290.1 GNAT family N-acetyltransferase [Bordetella genomosp. 1]